MRPLAALLTFGLLLSLLQPADARTRLAGTLVLTIAIEPGLGPTFTPELWRRVASEAFAADRVIVAEGTAPAPTERCRAQGALYAIAATLGPAGPDTDRHHAVARIDVRDCVTGEVKTVRQIAVDSVPMEQAMAGDFEPDPDRTWNAPVAAALARVAISFPALGRVRKVESPGSDPLVYIDNANIFRPEQQVTAFASGSIQPRKPVLMTIVTLQRGYAIARPLAGGLPDVGDYVRIEEH